YSLFLLVLLLKTKVAAKYRDIAERASANRWLQAAVFAPLFALTFALLTLPLDVYSEYLSRSYGLSVQSWTSAFLDWSKGQILLCLLAILLVRLLYAMIRKSPRGWWFYFWLISMPLTVFLVFLQPYVFDPMFHKFEPLQQKDPALTAALEKMVQRGGQD